MYSALFAADLHVGNSLPFAQRTEGAYTDRLFDALAVLDEMADYARENVITDLWFPGDVLDKRLLDAATLKAAMEKILAIADTGLTIRFVPGNHESHDAAGSMYTLRGFEGVRKNIEVWDENTRQEIGGYVFRGVPYKPNGTARDIIRRIRDEEANKPSVLILHQSIVGGKVGSWVCPDGIQLDDLSGFKASIAGHFHTAQQVGKRVAYLGAPIQHNFGDSGEARGFWRMSFGKDVSATQIETKQSQFRIANWSALKKGAKFEFNEGDYIQLDVSGTAAQVKRDGPDIDKWVADVRAQGVRLVKPNVDIESEKKTRMKSSTPGKAMTWPSAVSSYVDACDVTGLSRARLETLAREAITEAER